MVVRGEEEKEHGSTPPVALGYLQKAWEWQWAASHVLASIVITHLCIAPFPLLRKSVGGKWRNFAEALTNKRPHSAELPPKSWTSGGFS